MALPSSSSSASRNLSGGQVPWSPSANPEWGPWGVLPLLGKIRVTPTQLDALQTHGSRSALHLGGLHLKCESFSGCCSWQFLPQMSCASPRLLSSYNGRLAQIIVTRCHKCLIQIFVTEVFRAPFSGGWCLGRLGRTCFFNCCSLHRLIRAMPGYLSIINTLIK